MWVWTSECECDFLTRAEYSRYGSLRGSISCITIIPSSAWDIYNARGQDQLLTNSHTIFQTKQLHLSSCFWIRWEPSSLAKLVHPSSHMEAHPWEFVDVPYSWNSGADGHLTTRAACMLLVRFHGWPWYKGSARKPAALSDRLSQRFSYSFQVGTYGIRSSHRSIDLTGVVSTPWIFFCTRPLDLSIKSSSRLVIELSIVLISFDSPVSNKRIYYTSFYNVPPPDWPFFSKNITGPRTRNNRKNS